LIGCILTHRIDGKLLGGRIVETEAYLSKDDPACHASKGKSKRNETMFAPAGISYVYLIYGMYNCVNVVSGREGKGEAVLIRALEPLFNIENLCSGPGKLTQALSISREHNGLCLRQSELRVHTRNSFKMDMPKARIVTSTRIGITKGVELPLRFLLAGNTFVSKPA
ncbi:UNVERIFIED_CONTAM: hypothetical protein GTU68_049311, partial [Idotea baltica]|nr:hypothetical protein [Idotea baltica]